MYDKSKHVLDSLRLVDSSHMPTDLSTNRMSIGLCDTLDIKPISPIDNRKGRPASYQLSLANKPVKMT